MVKMDGSRWMVFLVMLAIAIWSPSWAESTPMACPQECSCEANGTVRCTSVAGLRNLTKSQPIARLDLSNLDLTKVPVALENIRNITELDLSNNRLAEVAHLGKRIRKLNLSHNRISSAKMARIPLHVESLNLTYNSITYLPLSLMKLKKLRYIELANNPINCTCETLHIRNWLTSRHVWSDNHIKCMAPPAFKGQPWLQVRQQDACNPALVEERKGGYNWDDYEDENELMLGDAPHSPDPAHEEDEDDFKREYLPVSEKVKRNEPPIVVDNSEDEPVVDGSGAGPETPIGAEERRKVFDAAAEDEGSGSDGDVRAFAEGGVDGDHGDEDASGSGGGLIVGFGHISADEIGTGSTASTTIDTDEGIDEAPEEEPMEIPNIDAGLGIFSDEKDEEPSPETTGSEETTSEATDKGRMIGAAGVMKTGHQDASGSPDTPLIEDNSSSTRQSEEDNQKTYVLLAIIGIIVVALIIMVVCKRKPEARNRRGKHDVESANGQGRELKELNKNLLEKLPADRNGHGGVPERTPLMSPDKPDQEKVFGDPHKTAFSPVKPQRTSLEKPMESFKPIAVERRTNDSLHELPVSDNNNTATLPNGNGALRNGDGPAGVHKPHGPSELDGPGDHLAVPMESPRSKRYSPIYVPTSPKSDRYSPVYSPETGRVKIKLTETPKPKTPILVTRSRSRAGDIITTMDDQKF
ncbi:protein windpipe [Anopheles nili]|uniref:protein windpipe n=1 Tax=Anopheles nili TaxID=185578 RepID=UPI00237A8557|nr:protein windpipe [Anopheles nili]XP_053675797.1 protein windpipe [Anopheles nili]XP_053675798.1 protein windpipe [Anopheles nili]